jgi:methionyl-tRNA formyltransferase
MKIVFIGNVHFSRGALIHLLGMKAKIVGVITREHSEFNADHTDLSDIATIQNIPFKYVKDINHPNNVAWIREREPDVIFCFGWSSLLKSEVLNIPRLGVVGYHPSLLPFNRGRHPIIWALALGLTETGSTFFFMDEGADTGSILSQREVVISPDDNAQMLYDRLTSTAMKQLDEFVPALVNGQFECRKQDLRVGNVWRKRGMADGRIDWRMSSSSIHNLVRALSKPYPGAHVDYMSQQPKVWKVEVAGYMTSHIEPGKVLALDDERILVKTGDAAIWLTDHDIKPLPEIGEYL